VPLIVLPGANGGTPATGRPGAPGAPALGNGGTASAEQATTDSADGIGYVPPDANEVPLADLVLLGRYF
jgi:hypothetical protein